jgi:aspartate racemase
LHIADATARHIYANGLHRIGLLGTRFTMEEDFIRGKLEREYGLKVIIPALLDREIVHRVIYEEFCAGLFLEQSRAPYGRRLSSQPCSTISRSSVSAQALCSAIWCCSKND